MNEKDPQNSEGGLTTPLTEREKAASRLFRWLDDHQESVDKDMFYDFGELGIFWLSWRSYWATQWVELQRLPFEVEFEG